MVSSAAGCRVEIEAEIEARREVRSVAAMQIELQSSRDEVERLSDLLAEQVRIAIVSTAGRSKYAVVSIAATISPSRRCSCNTTTAWPLPRRTRSTPSSRSCALRTE